MSYYYFPKSSPRPVKNGIKAASKRGVIGEQWWSQRFIDALHQMGMDNRLARGRTYARKGQVMRLSVTKGVVEAAVQGSRSKPYEITIRISQWDEKGWHKVITAIAGQALYSAQMLAGEMPHEIEQVVEQAGLVLFPKNSQDLKTACNCPDFANPCKHIAAVYYILAEQFDKDPFLIFTMRGKEKEDLLTALREERGAGEDEVITEKSGIQDPVIPELPAQGFYSVRKPLDRFSVQVTKAPDVKGGLIRSLGPAPCSIGKQNVADLIARAYDIAPVYISRMVRGDFLGDDMH